MRKYEPIWKLLKQEDKVEVQVAHPFLVPRIKKAVINEKNKDIPFRLLNDMYDFRLHISFDKEKGILTFTLKQRFGITVKDAS